MTQPLPPGIELEPHALPQAWQGGFEAADGARYRLLISVPDGPAPMRGFPTLLLVDGDALFASEKPFDAERRQRDLLPVPDGADRFLEMIAGELLPAIGRIAPLDPARRTLIGHSYGGLFALHALFTRPDLFEAHVAGSPSIWWQEHWIHKLNHRGAEFTEENNR